MMLFGILTGGYRAEGESLIIQWQRREKVGKMTLQASGKY
jgi:hypothetical protein